MEENECIHCIECNENEAGEAVAYCDIWGEWKNITLGDCFGNCEVQEVMENGEV